MSNGTKPDGGANLLVGGGRKLKGEVDISGSKNSAVALVTAAIIADTASVLENVPDISDIREIITILRHLGADVRYEDATHNTLYIDPTNLQNRNIPREFCDGFRASYYFAGSLLSKFLRAYVALPGGCDLGPRLFDQHEKAFVKLGSSWDINKGYFDLSANALNGCHITFDKVSVGATINAMLASVKANGLTVLENCAKEPHVVDVAIYLTKMGANIVGAGTDVIKVKGVRTLAGSVHSVIPDQIEAGTYMVAAAITKGDVTVSNVIPKHLEFITMKLREMGYSVTEFDDSVRVTVPELFDSRKPNAALQNIKIQTQPHPGFPTDMHPQFASLIASDVRYTGAITETIFDSRFSYVNELLRMGIRISVDGKTANINGVSKLNAARVKSTDLRAGAALIVAGLAADGTTVITETHHIERGYERIDEKLRKLGGNVWFSYENKTEEIDPISDDNVAVATAN